MPATQHREIKHCIEAILFASPEPLSINKVREILSSHFTLSIKQLQEMLAELNEEYLSTRSFLIEEVGQGFILRTKTDYAPFIEKLSIKRPEKLSTASTEVLAIIAYRQPITRPQIDAIRGVDSSNILSSLLERNLIAPQGKQEAPGRPTLYGVTDAFLLHYGLRSLQDLPPLEQ